MASFSTYLPEFSCDFEDKINGFTCCLGADYLLPCFVQTMGYTAPPTPQSSIDKLILV